MLTIEQALESLKTIEHTQVSIGAWLDYLEENEFFPGIIKECRRKYENNPICYDLIYNYIYCQHMVDKWVKSSIEERIKKFISDDTNFNLRNMLRYYIPNSMIRTSIINTQTF